MVPAFSYAHMPELMSAVDFAQSQHAGSPSRLVALIKGFQGICIRKALRSKISDIQSAADIT